MPEDGRTRLDARLVRRRFDRAASSFDQAAVLHREVAARMAERLQYVKLAPQRILDLGCGTGADFARLGERYPEARRIGCDASAAMLRLAGRHTSLAGRLLPWLSRRSPARVCADVLRLPFAAGSIDLVWSNLMLHWIDEPPQALREIARAMKVGGLLMFSTLGPDTLRELREAFASAGFSGQVHRFVDMHDLGDMLVEQGFAEPVMDMERIRLTYDDLAALAADLRATGSTCANRERARGLMGREALGRVRAQYETRRADGRLPATFEVVYGHAWKAQPRHTEDGRAIVRFDPQRRGR
jgi:malonyl-CoA O-methyltransferase